MTEVKFIDIIFGLQWGDEGKGKITNAISKKYDMVCRWNGGPNAGHTVYLDDKKYKTHIIPCGIFHNKPSIIGPNCVINIEKFYEEIEYLDKNGFDTALIKVSPNAHVITKKHISYDLKYLKRRLGTTGQGIAPCYASKMLREGILASSKINKKYLWDGKLKGRILCEGAQSFWLDINSGNYPYVTSSETLPYNACSLGFSPKLIRNIIGVAKIYDTKSGVDPLFPDKLLEDKQLLQLIKLGQEYGTTTGRTRTTNWLRLDYLIKAIEKSGANKIIFNKLDILESLNIYKIISNDRAISFPNLNKMKGYINSVLEKSGIKHRSIIYSGNKNFI